jgi:serine/threonine-protein kinase
MATVYVAEDVRHHRQVAVKVLHRDLAAGLSAERFVREVEITAQLLHPHILPLIDSGFVGDPDHPAAGGLPFYVMPFVEGESLRERLDREGELPVDEGLRILREIADALAHAHRRGIVHRDIKPENVLLTDHHALVADFGIAKALAESTISGTANGGAGGTSRAALTSLGIALGTPAYMAPEQAAADPHVDARADVYSLGVLAYEIFSGAPPFSGLTPQQAMVAHITRTPAPLARHRPALPAAVERIVMRCLEKRPADRWRNAEELLRQLDAVTMPSLGVVEAKPRELADRSFRLTEAVCRQLDRASLDPRMIGDVQHFLDNEVESSVLLVLVHGTGYDQRQFERILQLAPYRALAPTLYGFEPTAARRVVLPLADHLTIVREFIADAVARLRPDTTVLVGFSSGADVVLRLLAREGAPAVPVDGLLALGANLSLATCFVTHLLAQLDARDAGRQLQIIGALGSGAETLHDWLNIHEYLVSTLRKFGSNLAPLRRYSADIAEPFLDPPAAPLANPFVTWYRGASSNVRLLRCVFEDTPMIQTPLRALQLGHLDANIFGPYHRDGAIHTEPGTDHFDLLASELVLRHVEEMVLALREGRA